MKLKTLVSGIEWNSFAGVGKAYAIAETAEGKFTLFREPSGIGGPSSKMEGREGWRIESEGVVRAVVLEIGAPGVLARRRVASGVQGRLGDADLRITGQGSFRPGSRFVAFQVGERTITFRPHRLGVVLTDGNGELLAELRAGQWDAASAGLVETIAICLFEWAGVDSLLRFPMLALL
ncbi:hypothetical protein [Kitasatospora indigofera]|uniref:hypothetical protein n=1 Tax=Kitasatospora indigofera TaxID=67307 RepID=UPI00167DC917|nr:hypothetical protein [Kitasatospora indigofera]